MIVTRKRKDGSVRGYEVRAYDPRTREMRYAGFRAKLKGEGGANELEREKENEFAQLAAHGATDDRPRARVCRDLADRWIEDRTAPTARKRWKASSARNNREQIRTFVVSFGDCEPDRIPREKALAWARSVPVNAVDVARTMLNHSIDLGLCTTNCLMRPGISKGPGRKDDPPLTEDDLQQLYGACRVLGRYADAMRGWITFQAYVGCRPNEGLGLQRDKHIDLEQNLVHILQQKYRDGSLDTPKNGRKRTVILPAPARAALDLIPRRTDSPWLFHSKTGRPLLYAMSLDYWHDVMRKAGLDEDPRYPKGIDPYHLRHFCGSHLADRGIEAADIAIQLGHTDGGKLAQELYCHSYEDRARARLHAAYGQNIKPLRAVGSQRAAGGARS